MPVKKKAPAAKTTAKKVATKPKAAPKAKPAAKAKTTAKPAKKAAPKKEAIKKVAAKKPVAKKPAAPKKAKAPHELARDAALKVLDARKATDIVCVDLQGRSAVADFAIVATGGSARALGALAEYLREAFFQLGVKKLRIEGLPQGDWVLVDAGDVIVHLFRPEVRSFYQIEDIWSAKKPRG